MLLDASASTLPDPGMAVRLPRQDHNVILLLAGWFSRDARAQEEWARTAKKSVEYFEGKQWSAQDMLQRQKQRRPALTINKIRPLVNLVMGHFINNRSDLKCLPGNTGFASSEIAAAITHVGKAVSEMSQLPFVDVEVAMDGVLTGRGFYDLRLDHSSNVFGDLRWKPCDPFAIYLDSDADAYDLNESNRVIESRWVSIDEIEAKFGRRIAQMVQPLVGGVSNFSAYPSHFYDVVDEVTPWRKFGGETEGREWQFLAENVFGDWIDTARKNVRMIDVQWKQTVWQRVLVDLRTGDFRKIPSTMGQQQVNKLLAFAQERGEEVEITARQVQRVRWSQLIGDILVHDAWSPYQSFTKIGYFPYFRRGRTQGMVEHLFDAQDEINKRRTARLEITSRTAAGGWSYPKGMLDAQQKAHLKMHGSTPGVHVEWNPRSGGTTFSDGPKQIEPATSPIAQSQLEADADQDINFIAGINKDALGQVDKVQSGAAIKAKQSSAIVGLEGFMLNYQRTKELQGRKLIEYLQDHYKSERIIRVIGQGSSPVEMIINQMTADGVLNNIALGKYQVVIDETSLSDSFLAAQFEELLRMKEIGMPIPDDHVIDASSVARKEEMKMAVAAAREAEAMAAAAQPPAGPSGKPGKAPPGPKGPDGGNAPPQEAGAPPPALPSPMAA